LEEACESQGDLAGDAQAEPAVGGLSQQGIYSLPAGCPHIPQPAESLL